MASFDTNIGIDDADDDRNRPVSWFEARRRGLGDIGCGYWHGNGHLYPKTRLALFLERLHNAMGAFADWFIWLWLC